MDRPSPVNRIITNAKRDGIDLTVLPFLDDALESIEAISQSIRSDLPDFENATKIDTHVHPVPDWFRELQPLAAGRRTPSWDVDSHLNFMAEQKIKRSILCFSTPQANAFPADRAKTIALARLLNEFNAELGCAYPQRFSWLAVTSLPYLEEAIREVQYCLTELGALGVGILTNHEGIYPGDKSFNPLWEYLQNQEDDRAVVFIHPTDPVIRLEDGRFLNSNPSPLRAGLGEFYFETARAISSITANRTILEYPNIHWRVSHGAGAFPSIQDRFLIGFPKDAEDVRKAYATRFWYDSAGPVYPNQIKGLMANGVPTSQFVFGTDYPYGMGFWDVNANVAALVDAKFLSDAQKEAILFRNVERLWTSRFHLQ
ncbi:amidohydrolase 2 [Aaosphaeria arxii CBS 175.79]|uniref:Amidohydrolase 2 n=1 Tax=Aaosphaeria arxii CBS 175.79 TaxID=1450172 RepID=A0A6A5XD27_9PLEO|nr:amidohydrolase 2 [Aaosphaeria arxii CBS 175.79]KAF2010716.1 amidohydrolase 2 [Aaosphaeria arxii CBS 175.79]